MPVIENSSYSPPPLFSNAHVQTVFPTLFRRVRNVNYTRQRIETPDGDFIDIDLSAVGSGRAVIACHGLEGKSDRAYMKGMIRAFNRRGWDGVAFNYRGCSGEPNRMAWTYHSGKTDDLQCVIDHLLDADRYREIALVGFSLGANLVLKYAGERGGHIQPRIRSVAGISAPCDLHSSAIELDRLRNRLYSKRFLVTLVDKMREKEHLMPPGITRDYHSIRTLRDFDDAFTAPLNGFADAVDYWDRCSSGRFVGKTAVPTLVINAKDDPILGVECYPYEQARLNENLYLEVPEHGGHVGFVTFGKLGEYWHETRVAEFCNSHSAGSGS